MASDTWNPQQYRRFEKERKRPFYDLLALVVPYKNMQIVDLGCGTGGLTAELHTTLKAQRTLGIDASQTMLAHAQTLEQPGLKFERLAIEEFNPSQTYDLIFSNAALHWVSHHSQLLAHLSRFLSSEGQLAIQIPANQDYPTHIVAKKLALEPPFAPFFKNSSPPAILTLEEYACLLDDLKFKKQVVRMQVYATLLDSTESVVEWVKGAWLTYYQARLPSDLYQQFLDNYQERLLDQLGRKSPFFFPMKRILIWGQK